MEINIENKIFLISYENKSLQLKKISKKNDLNQIQFYFNIKGKMDLLFNENYAYNTSMSTPMVNHFKNTAEMLKERFNPKSVLEIGSNDGPFISNFPTESSFCVEPCDNFAKITGDMGYRTRTDFWNTDF